MQTAMRPVDEAARLETLRALDVLDTPPEERFDRIVRLAKRLFDVPIALVSFVEDERQWFKSRVGLDVSETSRDVSFCAHAIHGQQVFVVADALADARFHDNPLVVGEPHIRFYAGYPLAVGDGSRVGTLCIIDREPRTFSDTDYEVLRDLGLMAEQELGAVELATTDDLTGLTNRRGFAHLANQMIRACRRRGRPATVFYFDLDDLKGINDEHGHAAGDELIRTFADALTTSFRMADVVARLGGDEFAVLLGHSDAFGASRALDRLDDRVHEWNADSPAAARLSFSVGSATHGPDDPPVGIDGLMAEADARMYAHKRSRTGDDR